MTSRRFNQETSAAKKTAETEPVFITDRGRTSHVLMSIDHYQNITKTGKTLLQMIAQEEGGDFDFDIPRLSDPIARDFDFS